MRITKMSARPIIFWFAFALALGIGGTLYAAEQPKGARGFGEAKVAASVTFENVGGGTSKVKSFGKKSLGAIGDVVENDISFAFSATRDANGKVRGEMFLRDHTLNLWITGDIAVLNRHPKRKGPAGVKGHSFGHSVRMFSSKGNVVVNGKPRPAGWTFVNSPVFDGEKDIVCWELKDATGKKVYQWIAFLSSGDVTVK